jgi:hypothetical protein
VHRILRALALATPLALVLAVAAATPALADGIQGAAGRTKIITTGDGLRRLHITQSGYNASGNYPARAVTRLLPQRWTGSSWVAVTAQSLTVNQAIGFSDNNQDGQIDGSDYVNYGQDVATDSCRYSSSGTPGPVGCSIPNTSGVYIYSGERNFGFTNWMSKLSVVSVRFDRGDAHVWNLNNLGGVLNSGWWNSSG